MEPTTIFLAAMAAAVVQDKPPIVTAPIESSAGVQTNSVPQPVEPGRWISTADYPAAALRAQAEGSVGIRLSINASGRPAGCEVTQSSDNVDLDLATCRLVMARGRFEPARDVRGEAVSGNFTTTIHWRLRDHPVAMPEPGQMVITYTVNPDGTLIDCTSSGEGFAAKPVIDPCVNAPEKFAPQPSSSKGRPWRFRVTNRIEYLDEKQQ